MTHTDFMNPAIHALKRAHRPQEKRHGRNARTASAGAADFTIAIEGEPGTQAAEVARKVGRRLGWTVYDHEQLDRMAQELGLPVHLVEQVDERRRRRLLECLEALDKGPGVSESTYVWYLLKTLRFLASRGRCVIIGCGAAQLLSPRSTLRVSLVGKTGDRVAALCRWMHLDSEEAAVQAEAIFQERAHFIRHHFQKKSDLPENCDLVLNTSHLPLTMCADLILQALHRFREVSGAAALERIPQCQRGYYTEQND
jgi:Cytidylate kinase-like family